MDYKFATYIVLTILSFITLERALDLFINFLKINNSPYLYCENIVSEIGPREYFYRAHYQKEDLEIRVTPISADPDLFISYKSFPFYNLGKHDQDSCTCGVEVIKTNKDTRPVYTGVYCYSIYTNCTFHLSVCALDKSLEQTANALEYSINSDEPDETSNNNKKKIKSTFLMFIEVLFTELIPVLF